MNKLSISVTIKSVYGQDKIYPVCDSAKIFAGLLGQLTLTKNDLTKIKMLGYEINVVHQDIKL